ncbi:11797_t:CDS:2 [Paraglomus brasilianum]|uniref:11797_t:CDS:1 n=1 Tax=Paraglomus brasilianum TaxID=144538 RepID=A0A9N9D100_9GLOM|nr:11797_t:CDS:2 [Paraglomus brasilianum]
MASHEQCLDEYDNEYQQRIETSIQDGVFNCYLESDIDESRTAIAFGGCGVIFKGIIRTTEEPIAIKKLYSFPYNCKKTLDKMLAKEKELQNPLGDTPVYQLDFFHELFKDTQMMVFVNTLQLGYYQWYLDRIGNTELSAFENILISSYPSLYRRLDQITNTGLVTLIEFLKSKPCLYDALIQIISAKEAELAKTLELHSSFSSLCSAGMTVVNVIAKARALVI